MSAGDEAHGPRGADDWRALALCVVLVPALWLLLGWRPPLLVSGYDAVGALAPLLQVVVQGRGDPAGLAYRPEVMGGIALRDTLGPEPLLLVPAAFGLSVTDLFNLATFVTQALFAFFGQRAFSDLAVLAGRPRPPLGLAVVVGLVFVAFAPLVGWRVGYGHLTLLVGLLPFAAAFALAAAVAGRSLNAVLLAAAGLTTAVSLPFVGQQMVLYGALFGAPLVLGVLRAAEGNPWPPASRLRPGLLALAGGALLAAPGYLPMVRHATSSDALRDLGGPTMTWSYLTANALDALTSLPWLAPGSGIRADIQLHESNVPVGPLVLFLALLPRRSRPLLLGLAASALLAFALAANLRPISDLLLAVVPPLRSFRAPTRALVPALLVMPLLALAPLSFGWPGAARGRGARFAAGVGLGLGLFVAPPLLREAAAWALAAVVVWRAKRDVPLDGPLVLAAVLGLAGGSLGAFRERLLPFPDAERILGEARAQGDAVRQAEPGLDRPLTRVAFAAEKHRPEHPTLGANRALASGLASLDGYAFPQRRFVALVRALRGEPYSPTALILHFREAYPPSRVLFQLYNVAYTFDPEAPSVRPRGETAGPAWFPATRVVDGELSATAAALLAWGDATHAEARRALRVVADDPLVSPEDLRPLSPRCAEARVLGLEPRGPTTDRRGLPLTLRVASDADCPLVLATNYAEGLEAWGRASSTQESPQRLRTFPAYGALLGVLVPAGVREVEVRPRPWPPPFTLGLAVVGGLLLGVAAVGRPARLRSGR